MKRLALFATSVAVVSGLVIGGTVLTAGNSDALQADETAKQSTQDAPRGHRPGFGGLGTAAETIGIEPRELFEALRDGQTIAEVAEANGSSADAVVDAMVAAASERLDEAVADGKLTQEEADEKLADLEERIQGIVDGTIERPEGRRGPGRRGPGFGPGGAPNAEQSAA